MLGRRKKKPHPRSLDALFPRPKKPAVKRCPNGHRQGAAYRPGDPCVVCERDEWQELSKVEADRQREEFSRRNPCGPTHTIRVVSTGRLKVYAIPRHLRPDPAGALRAGLRYLRRTGDSLVATFRCLDSAP